MKELMPLFEKTSAPALLPESPEEKRLWEEIELADKPTRNALKRLNRSLRNEFPGTEIETSSSCSGHVQTDGSLAYEPIHPNFIGKVPPRERNPHLGFFAPADKISFQQRKAMENYLKHIFSNTLTATNEALGKNCISLLYRPEPKPQEVYIDDTNSKDPDAYLCLDAYLFMYRFPILEEQKNKAFDVFSSFWNTLEKKLSEIDSLQFDNHYELKDFL